MFIKSFKVEKKDSLIALMPAITRKFTYVEYIDHLPDRIITPGESLNLLEFKVRDDDVRYTPEEYFDILQLIKKTLHQKQIHLVFENIYKDELHYDFDALNFKNLIDENKSVAEIEAELEKREKQSDA